MKKIIIDSQKNRDSVSTDSESIRTGHKIDSYFTFCNGASAGFCSDSNPRCEKEESDAQATDGRAKEDGRKELKRPHATVCIFVMRL